MGFAGRPHLNPITASALGPHGRSLVSIVPFDYFAALEPSLCLPVAHPVERGHVDFSIRLGDLEGRPISFMFDVRTDVRAQIEIRASCLTQEKSVLENEGSTDQIVVGDIGMPQIDMIQARLGKIDDGNIKSHRPSHASWKLANGDWASSSRPKTPNVLNRKYHEAEN